MHDERLSRKFLGCYAGKICEPVVSMNNVELLCILHGDSSSDLGIAGHLFKQIGTILPGEFELLSESDCSLGDALLLHLLYGAKILFRIHIRNDVRVHIDKLHPINKLLHSIAYIGHRHITGIQYLGATLILVSGS